MTNRECILLSILLTILPFALYLWMGGNSPSDLGSLLGAFAAFLAVVWFYRGLRLQSIQINEQREQFSCQMQLQHQDSLLNFLTLASDKMQGHLKELITSLNIPDEFQLAGHYLSNMQYYKEATENADPNIVITQVQSWLQIEGPCVKFMSAVRDVVVLHQQRLGLTINSEITDPADYVFINSAHILDQPFMSPYKTSVTMLSEQMMLISPGRKAMGLAMSAALCQFAPDGIMKKEKIIQDIKHAQDANLLIPKVCEALLND